MLSVSTQVNPVGTRLVVETAASEVPDINATGAAGAIFMAEIDNSLNGTDVFLKIYDSAAPDVGSTPPDFVIRMKAATKRAMAFPEGLAFACLSFACVTTGGTAGHTPPTNPVPIRFVTT